MGARSVVPCVLLVACAAVPDGLPAERFLRVGVSPQDEAASVRAALEAAGWETTREVESARFLALAFRRGEEGRAVRVITSRGVVAALDSHEPDGIRARHGRVTLAEPATRDVDGDGDEELIVLREGGASPCLAVLRFEADGSARAIADEAAPLRAGACVARLEDVDGDGSIEAIVPLDWPELSMAEPAASIDVALGARDGGWRADAIPVAWAQRARQAREEALAAVRTARDVGRTVNVAVELAALAHLTGASVAAQTERFDAALSGLVLTDAERDRVTEIRAVIAAGWREPEP